MKKLISLILAAAVSLSSGAAELIGWGAQAFAAEVSDATEAVSVDIPAINERNFIPSRDFNIEVGILQLSDKTKYYTIETKCGDKTYPSVQAAARPDRNVSKTIAITNAKQGPVDICVKIYNGNKLVKEVIKSTTVMVPYQQQPMDYLSYKGMNGVNLNYMDYFHMMGLDNVRLGEEWYWMENKMGVINWPQWYEAVMQQGANAVYLSAYGNPLYSGENIEKKGPSTKTEIDAYARYTAEAAKKYPNVKYFEIWNEPNISFWLPTPNVVDYTYLIEVANQELKKVRDDVVVAGGSIAISEFKYIESMYQNNVFPSMDCLSTHPYGYPTGSDLFLQDLLSGFDEPMVRNGGWKESISTEFGWPTHVGNRGITPDQQAVEAVKHYVITDYNDYTINQFYRMNDLAISGRHDETYNEDNFGIVHYDGSPKPAVPAIKELCQRTNGGRMFGMMEVPEGLSAYLYLKDKKVTAVMWKQEGAPEGTLDSYTFSQPVTVYDLFGNYLYTGTTVALEENPVYVEGLSADTAAENLSYNVKTKLDEKIAFLTKAQSIPGFEEMKKILYEGVEKTKLEKLPAEEELDRMLEEYYGLGARLVEAYENGTYKGSITDLSAMLYILHLTGQHVMDLYTLSVNSGLEGYTRSGTKALEDLNKVIRERAGAGTLSYTSAIEKAAKELNQRVEQLSQDSQDSPMKAGTIKAWDRMVQLLCAMAEEEARVETPGWDNILIQMPSSEYSFDLSTEKTSNLSLYNYSTARIEGVIEVLDPAGDIVGASETVALDPDTNTQVPVKIRLDGIFEDGAKYQMRFVQDGKALKTQVAPIHIRTKVGISMGLIETNFQGINQVTVNVENLIDEAVLGDITVTPPEGWSLAKTTQSFSVEQATTGAVTFPVSKKTAMPFHFYAFRVTITDKGGKTIYDNNLPLTFSTVVKADKEYSIEDFDGEINDWSNAYPIYLGIPKDATSAKDWQECDIAARVLTKWDENYLYLLVDAFDNVHLQNKTGGDIWNGDCVQVSIDPNNDKNDAKYESEDYEYGFAYSDVSGNTAYSWYKPDGKPGMEPSTYSTMKREDSTHLSRYLIKLPASAIAPMELKEGGKFGYNVVLNDGDFTDRERFIEYVPGTGADKKPSIYPTYKLIGKEDRPAGKMLCPIPLTMEPSNPAGPEGSTEAVFSDIKGHWAEQIIASFAAAGYVQGTGEGVFEPDRSVTRGEFTKMLTQVLGLSTEGAKPSYMDVAPEHWCAPFVGAAEQAGLIPVELGTSQFLPDAPILREETMGMIGKYLKQETQGIVPGDVSTFADAVALSPWAEEYAALSLGAGIIQGDAQNRLNPKETLTRAEAAAVLSRLLG